jgi:oxygen-independent coproporphyrinogen-3 oxidase
LRLSEGVAAERFAARTGVALDAALDPATLRMALDEGYLRRDDGRLQATAEGRKRLDALLAALVL